MRIRTTCLLAATTILAAPAAASAYYPHTVVPGESLYSIAAADGMSVAQLAAANGLPASAQLLTGSVVQIPPAGTSSMTPVSAVAPASTGAAVGDPVSGEPAGDDGGSSAVATPASASSGSGGSYVVPWGDTLSAIAARAGTTVAALAVANGIDPNAPLLAGSVLRLSGAGGMTSASGIGGPASAATQPVGSAAAGSSGSPPYPTPERVTASQIGSIASANGVPPALAAAIGWQESGFNNDLVSPADARGVMQILPGTWDWIQRTLTPGNPLAPASASSNVRGGVLLLHSLLNSTGGSPSLAAAGYYQGLPSVQAHGMYRDTQQYVGNVMSLAQRFGGL